MRSEFDEWYEKWTGSKVKCENTDIIGAWQHQQTKADELQYRIDTSLDEIRRALNCVESTETECVLRELEQALKGGSND